MSTKHNIYGSLFVSNNITGDTLTLSTINQDDTLTKVLVWSDSSNRIVYRNLSTITGDTNVDTNTFVSGGTYNGITNNIDFNGNSTGTTFNVDLTSLVNSVSGDTYIVSGNANAATSELTFNYNTGGTIVVSNSAALFSDNDINVTGGTYNPSNGCITFSTNSGTTFDVCGFVTGFTDSYTTDAYLSGTEVRFDNSVEGSNYYNVDLNSLLSGKTDNTTFNTYTANTQTILDGKIDSVNNVGGTNEFFKDKSGSTLNFRTLSGGSNTTVSTVGDVVKVDVNIPTDTNTFITGFTYNNSNVFTISRNDGVDLSTSINQMTGLTVNGSLSATTYFGDGSNLTGISVDDNFVTGGTLNGGTLTLERQNGIVTITGFTDDVDTYVTGGTVSVTATNDDNDGTIGLFYKNSEGVPHTLPFKDTFVTGGTYDNSSYTIGFTKNDSTTFGINLNSLISSISGDTYIVSGNANAATSELSFTNNSGGTFNVTNSAALFSDNDINVTGGTYNPSNGCVTFNTNSGTTFDVCGFVTGLTDSYTTTSYLSGSEIRFDNNIQGVNYYNVDLGPLLSGFTTGNTLEETLLLGNVSSGNDIVMSEGDDIVFKYAGFNNNINTNPLTSNRTILFQDKDGVVALLSDTTGHTENFYVTGFTYDNANTFTISRNDGVDLSTSINTVTGLTVNGNLNATTILSGGTNLTTVIESLDTYVTGGTVSVPATDNTNSGSIGLFYKNSDGIPRTLPFEDTFVTGTTFTSNEATLTRNDGFDVLKITGDTNVVLSNPSTNQIKLGLDLGIKSGVVRGTDFTGNPKTYKVIFTTPYTNNEYSINITGISNRNYTYQDKTNASFVINTNANSSFTEEVDWVTIKYGEQ